MEIEQINKYVGSKIKDYRKSFGLSQEELAKKIGVGKTTISNYEVGIRSPKKPQLIKLSEVFDVAIDDFFPQTVSTRINVSSILSEINKISSQLEEPRQKVVLDNASTQLEEQEKAKKATKPKPKVTPLFDMDSPLTDEELQEAVDEAVAFDGVPLTDREKELYKHLLREAWEEDHGRG